MSRRDDRRFRDLFDRYYPAVFAVFMRWGFAREEAQDLSQVTFMRVYKGMEDYRGDAEWSYVIQIANRVRLNELRFHKAQRRGVKTEPLDGLEPPSAAIRPDLLSAKAPRTPEDEVLEREHLELQEERIRLLREAIAELPPRMRRCLLMRLDEGLKYREIATALKVSLDAVRSLLFQARKRLQERLPSSAEEQPGLFGVESGE